MYRIYIVEDDEALASAMKQQLETYGNEVILASDFRAVSDEFSRVKPHLVLMDIMLPVYTGFYWVSEIRKSSTVPVIFISSAASSMNIVTAINMGGDDFIAKPVEPMVLSAKVQAVLRRSYELWEGGTYLECRGAILCLDDATLSYKDEKIDLTKNEFRILKVLFENKGKIVTRESLMTALWQSDIYVEENTLTVNVGRLRKKLEEHGLNDLIVTKAGSGYMAQ